MDDDEEILDELEVRTNGPAFVHLLGESWLAIGPDDLVVISSEGAEIARVALPAGGFDIVGPADDVLLLRAPDGLVAIE